MNRATRRRLTAFRLRWLRGLVGMPTPTAEPEPTHTARTFRGHSLGFGLDQERFRRRQEARLKVLIAHLESVGAL